MDRLCDTDLELDKLVADYCASYKGSKVITDKEPLILTAIKVGRNDKCPCGSGKKFKKCCGK